MENMSLLMYFLIGVGALTGLAAVLYGIAQLLDYLEYKSLRESIFFETHSCLNSLPFKFNKIINLWMENSLPINTKAIYEIDSVLRGIIKCYKPLFPLKCKKYFNEMQSRLDKLSAYIVHHNIQLFNIDDDLSDYVIKDLQKNMLAKNDELLFDIDISDIDTKLDLIIGLSKKLQLIKNVKKLYNGRFIEIQQDNSIYIFYVAKTNFSLHNVCFLGSGIQKSGNIINETHNLNISFECFDNSGLLNQKNGLTCKFINKNVFDNFISENWHLQISNKSVAVQI